VNPILRSALALLVGFVAASAVFAAVDRDDEPPTEGTIVGDIDVFEYCRSKHGNDASAVLTNSNAFGWRCTARPNDIFMLVDVDLNDACRTLFEKGAVASVTDETDPYSWVCTVP